MSRDSLELRGQAPADLVRALDAIALAKGVNRTAYVNQVLEAHVKAYFSEYSLVCRALRDNPLLTDATGIVTG